MKVIDMDLQERKIALSIKALNRDGGEDDYREYLRRQGDGARAPRRPHGEVQPPQVAATNDTRPAAGVLARSSQHGSKERPPGRSFPFRGVRAAARPAMAARRWRLRALPRVVTSPHHEPDGPERAAPDGRRRRPPPVPASAPGTTPPSPAGATDPATGPGAPPAAGARRASAAGVGSAAVPWGGAAALDAAAPAAAARPARHRHRRVHLRRPLPRLLRLPRPRLQRRPGGVAAPRRRARASASSS